MATEILSAKGAATTPIKVLGRESAQILCTSGSFNGIAYLQVQANGREWVNQRQIVGTIQFTTDGPGVYRVQIVEYTSGTLTVSQELNDDILFAVRRENGEIPFFVTRNGPSFPPTSGDADAGMVPRTIRDKLLETVSVKDFGVKGDGVADDTDALTDAFNAVLSGNGKLVFPKNMNCRITSKIQVKVTRNLNEELPGVGLHFSDNEALALLCYGSPIIFADAAMDAMLELIFDTSDSDIGPFYSTIQGLSLDGRGLATTGIKSNFTMHNSFYNNRLWNLTRGIEYVGYGVFEAAHNVLQCRYGFYCVGGGGDSTIRQNDFFAPGGVVGAAVYLGHFGGNTVITGNIVTDEAGTANYYGVHLDGATAPAAEEIRHVTISDNEFCGLVTGVKADGKATPNIYAIQVRGNHTTQFGSRNPGRLVDFTNVNDSLIVGNSANSIDLVVADGPAMSFTTCSRVDARGNHIADYLAQAITATNCTDIVVDGNSFYDCARTSAATAIITLSGASTARARVMRNVARQSNVAYGQVFVEEVSSAAGSFAVDNRLDSVANGYTKAASSVMRREEYGTAIPVSGTYNVGDILWNTAVASSGILGWVCVTAGAPGTWSIMGKAFNSSTGSLSLGGLTSGLSCMLLAADASVRVGYAGIYSASDANGHQIQIFKRRGGTGASTIVSSGDEIFSIEALGYDGAANQLAAAIRANVDGTPGAGDMPGRLDFFTTADGTSTLVRRARIDNAGNFRRGTALLATTATGGFDYTPACAGAPTGVPAITQASEGNAPMVIDTTNLRIYVNIAGTWRFAQLT